MSENGSDYDYTPSIEAAYDFQELANSPPPLRQLLEHLRRQAIEDVRKWDMLLYGRSDKTIPARKR